eukprot:m.71536 g.71536  ORF g.71536 m.71536 type:complete len:279 (+) comp10071_c0_seq2:209-1045(+)
MEPNMSLDEINTEPTNHNRSPATEETPGRMIGLPKSLLASHGSFLETSPGRSLAEWGGKGEGKTGRAAATGGDGLSDSSNAAEEAPPSPGVVQDDVDSDGSTAGPALERVGPESGPSRSSFINIDMYKSEAQIISRMQELRKRYSESLQHVRRLRRSLGSLSPTPDDLDRRIESDGWDEDAQRGQSRGSDELEEDVFDEPSARPRVKSLKRPEVVAQEKGIATASLFSTKPSTDEIKIDENGYKSYQCLLCSRTFTHPPAFSQHKRAHGREAAVDSRN